MKIGDWVRCPDHIPLEYHYAAVVCGQTAQISSEGSQPGTFMVTSLMPFWTVCLPASLLTPVPNPYQQPEGEPKVSTATNFSTAIFLYNAEVRAMRVTYENDEEYKAANHGRLAPRELAKTLDDSIKVGDLCIVPSGTRHGFTIVKVVEADVDFDIETTENVKWIAAKFDQGGYNKALAWEESNNNKIRSAQRTAKRAELAAKIKADNPALAGSFAAIEHSPAPEPAPAPGQPSDDDPV